MATSTRAVFEMFVQTISAGTISGIFSPALESGLTHSDKPDGLTTSRSLRRAHHANPGVLRESNEVPMTIGTYGRTFFASPVPCGGLISWESKLRERLARLGSTEFDLTWKVKTTAAGRSLSQLVPSTRRTFDPELTGLHIWPSPEVGVFGTTDINRLLERRAHYAKKQGNNGFGLTLGQMQTLQAPWSTPRSSDGDKGGPNQAFGAGGTPLPAQMHQSTWSTPQTRTHGGGSYQDPAAAARIESGHQVNLQDQMVAWAGREAGTAWATPTARDFRSGKASLATHDRNSRPLVEQMTEPSDSGTTTNGSSVTTEKRGVPNPAFPCWLMGLEEEYLCGEVWETPSSRRSPSK